MNPQIKTYSILIILTLNLIISIPTTLAEPNTSPLQTIHHVGGTGPHNYTQIQNAINTAHPYDIIYIHQDSSPYHEHLIIDKPLTLQGEETTTTTIQGTQPQHVIIITNHSITISHLTISTNQPTHIGIYLTNTHNITLHHLIITNHRYGIYSSQSTTVTLHNSTLKNNNEALYLSQTHNTTLTYTTIMQNSVGIHTEHTNHLLITHNSITSNDEGSTLFQTTKSTLAHNYFHNNNWFGSWFINCTHNQLINNEFTANIDIGLYLELSQKNLIQNNKFYQNDDGIYLEYSHTNTITYNSFYNLKYNLFYVGHTLQDCRNTITQNYWDRPRILPYPILGTIKKIPLYYPWIRFDFRPLKTNPTLNTLPQYIPQILYVGGNGPGNYSEIQDAINNASTGDLIYVYPGNYTESLTVNKSITLKGANSNTTILDGQGRADIIKLTANNITITQFTILNGHYGIYTNNTTHHQITHNKFIANLHGISLHHTTNTQIDHNNFETNPYGIRLYYCKNIHVTHNHLSSYKINAFFIASTPQECRHTWKNNIWDTPKILPVPILGKYQNYPLSFFIVNIDWTPH